MRRGALLMERVLRRGLGVVLGAVLVSCGSPTNSEPEGSGPPPGSPANPPVPMPAQSAEFPKSLVVQLVVTDSTLRVAEIAVVGSRTHSYVGQPDQFRIALVDRAGKVLGEIATYDPPGLRVYESSNLDSTALIPDDEGQRPERAGRGSLGDEQRDTASFRESHVMRDSANAEIIVPFVPGLDSLRFTLRDRPARSFPVRAELTEYCLGAGSDTECRDWLRETGR